MNPLGCKIEIKADGFPRPPEPVQGRAKVVGVFQPDALAQGPVPSRRQLAGIHEQAHRGVGLEDGEAERKGGVRHVAAAQVQQPGDGIGRRQQRRVELVRLHGFCHVPAFVGGGSSREGDVLGHHRRDGRRRLIGPDGVYRVFGLGHQGGPGLFDRCHEAGHLIGGVQPGIVSEPLAPAHVACDPAMGRPLREVMALISVPVHLGLGLEGIAAVHEQGGAVPQHHREPGGAGETGEPGQAFRAPGHEFALVFVAAPDDETVEAAALQPAAKDIQPVRAVPAAAGGGRHLVPQRLELAFQFCA